VDGVAHAVVPTLRAELFDVLLVDDGIQPGDRIILTNLEEVADGTRVRVVDMPKGSGAS